MTAILFRKLSEAKASERAAALLLQQTTDIKQMYEQQKILTDERAKKLHEYRNQIQTIGTLAENGKFEELKSFIGKIAEDFLTQTDNFVAFTDNAVINSLLNVKSVRAKSFNKELIIKLESLPGNLDVYDLSVVLANALDNAIEAKSFNNDNVISLNGIKRAGSYIFIISNSYSEKLKYSDNSLLSTKGKNRGFGISNISSAASKYDGVIDVKAENNKFVLSILLKYE